MICGQVWWAEFGFLQLGLGESLVNVARMKVICRHYEMDAIAIWIFGIKEVLVRYLIGKNEVKIC